MEEITKNNDLITTIDCKTIFNNLSRIYYSNKYINIKVIILSQDMIIKQKSSNLYILQTTVFDSTGLIKLLIKGNYDSIKEDLNLIKNFHEYLIFNVTTEINNNLLYLVCNKNSIFLVNDDIIENNEKSINSKENFSAIPLYDINDI